MKKITLLLFMFFLGALASYAQHSCTNAVAITNGYTVSNVTTPGAGVGSPAAWVTQSIDCQGTGGISSTLGTNSTCWNQVFDSAGDDYLFSYTTGATAGESIFFEIRIRQSYMGIMAFTDCNGTSISGCLSGAYAAGITNPATLSVSANNLQANQTIYIGVGVWSLPNNLDFDVTNFTVTPPALGIDDLHKDEIKLFPNPVTDMLNISGLKNVSNVAIYNMLGQEVIKQSKLENEQVDVSGLAPGTYLVKVNTDVATETYKIVKK